LIEIHTHISEHII